MELSENARITYEKRYLIKDQHGHPVETPEDLLRRVAKNIAAVEKDYKKDQQQIEQIEEEFFQVMADALFMPNSPTLMNAGRELQQLSACFVLPIEDSMEGIFTSLKQMALVQKTGGGTGFAFDRLRPSGDFVCSTNGVASGPISFLKIFDAATEAVKQGGTRRGANMGSLIYNHPNILDFICCKENEDEITNFNLSVTVSDEFMRKATGEDPDPMYPLINPRNGQPHVDPETGQTVSLNAVEVFNLIVDKAWSKGDPGVIFIDQMNRFNPTPHLGKYETTNPCGEQPLLPYEACCLGSINLGKFVTPERQINWDELRRVIKIAVRFLDNVIDASNYVIEEIAQMHKHGNRKIGLGVMGWHDMLVKLGIPYDSEEALETADQVMSFINAEAKKVSVALAKERGVFPNFKGSIYDTGRKEDRVRNATRTTIAPTGTISILAGASSGIEPYFSIAFTRKNILGGLDLPEVNPLFLEMAKAGGFYSEELMKLIARNGTIPPDAPVPEEVRRLFKTAMEIDVSWHVRHQAAFQKHTDNAVSKTINLRRDASQEDVKNAYIMAWKLGCKGITIYRDGSREKQVLNAGAADQEKLKPSKRPKTLKGSTTCLPTSLGNLFVTLNTVDGKPFELFAQIGKAGSDVVAFTEAIARLISLALRCGVAVEEIVAQLEGIGGARSVGFGPNRIMSVPDAIGRAIRELASISWNGNGNHNHCRELCPDCGTGALIRVEGCAKCEACGYSEC
ncbi:MAG TPA: vitamin B12-dependent ribonucleotide reductase [Bacillota bacterium]|nr:vitamin B12-dependent ribonucleotide reductase [Bacillota bacterium]HOB86296.1 vitamin B12-dependent ribonucleotide reductase [Bacillota bacterium]HOP69623.1 vitamin B12-dependent ribonucleotide reductase [Bacillota bacterium]HPT34700.1 vitamin B12-dependent ribonucleotide reductase [Bacillota bacterium]HQD06981.1 vitamin B12-dependent ribonucleotide reductase [Bacillota bacterium]